MQILLSGTFKPRRYSVLGKNFGIGIDYYLENLVLLRLGVEYWDYWGNATNWRYGPWR